MFSHHRSLLAKRLHWYTFPLRSKGVCMHFWSVVGPKYSNLVMSSASSFMNFSGCISSLSSWCKTCAFVLIMCFPPSSNYYPPSFRFLASCHSCTSSKMLVSIPGYFPSTLMLVSLFSKWHWTAGIVFLITVSFAISSGYNAFFSSLSTTPRRCLANWFPWYRLDLSLPPLSLVIIRSMCLCCLW